MDFEGGDYDLFSAIAICPFHRLTFWKWERRKEGSVLHSVRLSSVLLCTSLLIVNWRSYDTEVRRPPPFAVGLLSSAVPFLRMQPPPPPPVVTCMCRSEWGGSLVSHSSAPSEQLELIQGVGWLNIQPVARLSLWRRSAVYFCCSCFYINPLYLWKIHRASHSHRQTQSSIHWAAPLEQPGHWGVQ